jgi:hypothetical protein
MADSPLKQRFVLDTSLFLSPEIRRDGEGVEPAVERLLDTIATARLRLNISCYVAPSVHAELVGVLRDRGVADEVLSKLNTWVIKKNPSRYEVMVPAEIVHGFIDEMSDRVDRGLRVAEQAVRRAGDEDPERVVSDLRDEYRRTLRRGVLDSREDFDLLILARELDAGVVTEDTGIVDWAGDFGLRYLRGRDFPDLLAAYLDAVDAA